VSDSQATKQAAQELEQAKRQRASHKQNKNDQEIQSDW